MALKEGQATSLAKVLLVVALIVPIALDVLFSVNTTEWPAAVATIWDNLPIIAIAGLLIAMLSGFGRSSE